MTTKPLFAEKKAQLLPHSVLHFDEALLWPCARAGSR